MKNNKMILAAGVAAALLSSSATAQTIAITGGKVFPVSDPPIENGTVVITNGKITAVGANVSVPANAQRIDATGKWVTPGLINSSTQLGLVEIGQVSDTREIVARRPTETNGISRSALLKEARLRSACSSDAADSDWQQAWGQHPQ